MIFEVPDGMTDEQAAGFLIASHTAHHAAIRRGGVASGETVVVLGAAGGLGSAIVQLCVAQGARVIAVVGGPEKAAFCRELGAEAVDHFEGDYVTAVRELVGGGGVDVVMDPVQGEMGAVSDRLLVPGGRRVVCGHAGGLIPHDPDFYLANHSLVGVDLGGYPREVMRQFHLETQDALTRLMAEGRYSPRVERRVTFDEVPAALEDLAARRTIGRVVVDIPQDGRSDDDHLGHTDERSIHPGLACRPLRAADRSARARRHRASRPGPGEILVRTSASVCNYNEVDGCHGRYLTINPPLPYTLGMEFVGEVIGAGEGAQAWVGRRVMGTGTGAIGAHAELVVGPVDMAFDVPAELSDVEAAAFFYPFHLAHLGLHERGRLQPGETVLVHAAAGGVGSAAVQLAVAAGARVIATAGGPEKLDFARGLGADVAIDYRDGGFAPAVLDATGGPRRRRVLRRCRR